MRVIPFVWLQYVEPELMRARWNHIVKLLLLQFMPPFSTPHLLIPILDGASHSVATSAPRVKPVSTQGLGASTLHPIWYLIRFSDKRVTPHDISQGVQHVADILMESYGYPSHFVYRRRPIRISRTVDALIFDNMYETYIVT